MSANSTISYHMYRNTYTPTTSNYRPYRSTYSTDYSQFSTRTTSSLYKPSSYVSSVSRSGYSSTARTLPTLGRTSSVLSYDHSPSTRTLPIHRLSTHSYDSNRSSYTSYSSTKRDVSKYSSVKPSPVTSISQKYDAINDSNCSATALKDRVSRKSCDDDTGKDVEVLTTHHGSNTGNDLKQLGGNPKDVAGCDSDIQPKLEEGSRRRSPSMERVSKEVNGTSRSTRHQSVDRTGETQKSLVGMLDASTKRGQTGLRNLGNTCFMNSILQCLANTRPLLEFCLSSSDYELEINSETSRMKGNLFVSFARLLQSMWNGHDSISPTEFKSELSRFARRFGGYNQQDAQEFLISLLEGLQDDLNRVRDKKRRRHIDSSNEVETISASDKARDSWKTYLAVENSRIVDLFVGQMQSALTCLNCGYVSNTFDPFLDLSLPIPKGRSMSAVSLQECFDLFTQEETLDGDERPTCARCRKRQKCTKKLSIQKFPQILIIHLKRFSQDYAFRSKLSTEVRCPTKSLDLKKFSSEKAAGNVSYELFAVSNHSGTPSGGHYTATAKNPFNKQWHYFNDQRVNSCTESDVISSEAYILFYELSSSSNASQS